MCLQEAGWAFRVGVGHQEGMGHLPQTVPFYFRGGTNEQAGSPRSNALVGSVSGILSMREGTRGHLAPSFLNMGDPLCP